MADCTINPLLQLDFIYTHTHTHTHTHADSTILVYYFELDDLDEGGDKDLRQVGHVGLDTWCCIQECRQ